MTTKVIKNEKAENTTEYYNGVKHLQDLSHVEQH